MLKSKEQSQGEHLPWGAARGEKQKLSVLSMRDTEGEADPAVGTVKTFSTPGRMEDIKFHQPLSVGLEVSSCGPSLRL